MSPIAHRGSRVAAPDARMTSHAFGRTLVIHPRDRLTARSRSLALAVATDPQRPVVVVDLPEDSPIELWRETAGLMPRGRHGVRVVVAGRSRETTALAGQVLAECLRRPVHAHDGRLVDGAGGALFVDGEPGSGWTRYRPGRPPRWEARRFPRPRWECGPVADTVRAGPVVVEPILAGVWIRSVDDSSSETALSDVAVTWHRDRLQAEVPCQDDVLTVVVGAPGTPRVPLAAVRRLWEQLPVDLLDLVRVVVYGPVEAGGERPFVGRLADSLETGVVAYNGLPAATRDGAVVHVLRADGNRAWRSLASEVLHPPGADEDQGPVVLAHDAPMDCVEEVSPAVYWYAPDAVVEVVQCGLWVRPVEAPDHAGEVRRLTATVEHPLVLFDSASEPVERRMRRLAEEVVQRLADDVRVACRIAATRAVLPARPRDAGPLALSAATSTLVPGSDRSGPDRATARRGVDVADSPELIGAVLPARPETGVVDPGRSPDTSPPVTARALPAPEPAARQATPPSRRATRRPTEDPSPTTPVVTAVDPTGLDPTGLDPTGLDPTGLDPTGLDPTRHDPPGLEPLAGPATVAAPARGSRTDPRVARASREPVVTGRVDAPVAGRPRPPASEPGDPPTAGSPAVSVQPTPQPDAVALLPEGGIERERRWLRESLGQEFAERSAVVTRLLSEHPGLGRSQGGDALTDAVAVSLLLDPRGASVDDALRAARPGDHVAFARCAVSGLDLLPSHRGPVVLPVQPDATHWDLLRRHQVLTEWSFLHALTAPCESVSGAVDVVVWSMTARRTRLLEPPAAGVADRVVFPPGCRFKVLRLDPQSGATRGRILLRELAAAEVQGTGEVVQDRRALDDVAVTSMEGALDTWRAAPGLHRLTAPAERFAHLPGLLPQGADAAGRSAA